MKRVSFLNSNRSGDRLHIETEGCIVNIRVGLEDTVGRTVTHIEIIPDKYAGEEWDIDRYGSCNNRLIKRKHNT